MDLEQRIARLEAIESIKTLKHRYLRACDAKRPDDFRNCFVAEGAVIDYGPRIGKFEDADGIADVFARLALQRVDDKLVIFDMHHAMHADIEVLSNDEAQGRWTLRFRQVNLAKRTEQVSAIEYADRYVVENGEWRISSCEVSVLWTLVQPLAEGFELTESFS